MVELALEEEGAEDEADLRVLHAEAAVVDPPREEDETLLTRVAALHHVAIGIGTSAVLNPQKTRSSHSF